MSINELIKTVPKTELHLHIEGSLEPELMMQLAMKNKVELPYQTVEEVKQAYQFNNLQEFLDLYYRGASVLREEDDFYQLFWAYLNKCRQDNVVHTEVMFDPQTHTERGIGFDVFMPGFQRAIDRAKAEWGMSVFLIMSFLRHLSEQSAIETLQAAELYREQIKAVGLDSSEQGNPPDKFKQVFAMAKAQGFLRVAHAGEEGPPEYIWSALEVLDVHRIDHGVRSVEDAELLSHLAQRKMPLTVCPLSNIKLCVFEHMQQHNILALLDQGLMVTVNADDPSYFGGYLNDNYLALAEHLSLSKPQLKQLILNSFQASFLSDAEKATWTSKVEQYF